MSEIKICETEGGKSSQFFAEKNSFYQPYTENA